ncbi:MULTISPECIES: hypothetical protein [unclassified Streptomyces]|uniref:hypothetical protein n=1 Tax=unclassified Streptomyces TaxID=2593676 RepID=UPI002E21EF6E|nr:hypothetical protein OG217_37475 [Streptomyces sp. NBC_01023]WSV01961.1 hypothetical protein OG217_37655 [Streptomyces sp. NBC_01023]
MHASLVLPAAQIAVTTALVAAMISAFTPLPGRWFRWRMFCRGTFTIISLTGTKGGRTEPVNIYQAIVTYLTDSGRYDRIDGHGRVLSARGEHPVEVKDSHVLVL